LPDNSNPKQANSDKSGRYGSAAETYDVAASRFFWYVQIQLLYCLLNYGQPNFALFGVKAKE
jgi:hypothetical protein